MPNTGFQPDMVLPPSIHTKARRSSPPALTIIKELSAVAKDETATPARIRLVTGRVRPTRASRNTRNTARSEPAKDASGTARYPRVVLGQFSDMAATAPTPAPEAAPIR